MHSHEDQLHWEITLFVQTDLALNINEKYQPILTSTFNNLCSKAPSTRRVLVPACLLFAANAAVRLMMISNFKGHGDALELRDLSRMQMRT
jgi:hypothetical protein